MAEQKSWWQSAIDTVGGTFSDVLDGASQIAEMWASTSIASALGFEQASAAAETPATTGSGGDTITPLPATKSAVPVWMWAVGAALLALVVLQPRGR